MTWKKAYHANCWGPLGSNAMGVSSITQLTYRTFGDMERAIREIGEAGFTDVELFDGNLLVYEVDSKMFAAVLVSSGVKFLATYSGGNAIMSGKRPLPNFEEGYRVSAIADTILESGKTERWLQVAN